MSSQLALFLAIPISNIKVLFDTNSQPWFKCSDLGGYLGITKVRSMQLSSLFCLPRSKILVPQLHGARSGMQGGGKNSHDVFINLDSTVEVAIRSNKPKAVELTQWLMKNNKTVESKRYNTRMFL